MQVINARQGQTLLDLSLMATGSTEAAWEMAVRNNMQLDDALVIGAGYIAPDAIADKAVLEYYAANGIVPATNPEL